MGKRQQIFIKSILAIMIGMAIALTATACGCSRTVLSADNETEGVYIIKADGAKSDAFIMSNFEIPEGASNITVKSELTKGKLHIKIGGSFDDALDSAEGEIPEDLTNTDSIVEMDVEVGMSDTTIPLEAGSYSISITGTDQKASGTVTITAQ